MYRLLRNQKMLVSFNLEISILDKFGRLEDTLVLTSDIENNMISSIEVSKDGKWAFLAMSEKGSLIQN